MEDQGKIFAAAFGGQNSKNTLKLTILCLRFQKFSSFLHLFRSWAQGSAGTEIYRNRNRNNFQKTGTGIRFTGTGIQNFYRNRNRNQASIIPSACWKIDFLKWFFAQQNFFSIFQGIFMNWNVDNVKFRAAGAKILIFKHKFWLENWKFGHNT